MRLIILSIILSLPIWGFAQVPQGIPYQAVARNGQGQPLANTNVKVRFSILDSTATGTAVYVESHSTATSALGLFSANVGMGTASTGTFSAVNWGQNYKFLKVELDTTATGNSYIDLGTQQMMSVPYALYAGSANSLITSGNISTSIVLPNLYTSVDSITSNSVKFIGSVSNVDLSKIIEQGFVYSKSPNPNLSSSKIVVSLGLSAFDTTTSTSMYICNQNCSYYPHILSSGTHYYARSYAINENNICVYGNQVEFNTLTVGQTSSVGGIVFYDKGYYSGGWRYIESFPYDQSPTQKWGCAGTNITGTSTDLFTGGLNTNIIASNCNDSIFAAKTCKSITFGGQSDWVLPSRDELNLMYLNLKLNNIGGFNSSIYWSSSQKDLNNVNCIHFQYGYLYFSGSWGGKAYPQLFRAVRYY